MHGYKWPINSPRTRVAAQSLNSARVVSPHAGDGGAGTPIETVLQELVEFPPKKQEQMLTEIQMALKQAADVRCVWYSSAI